MAVTETEESKKKRVLEIIKRLKKIFPDAGIELHFKTPVQLIVATILSAQCTDKRVNMVTPPLFKKYKTAKDFANANQKTFEREIHSTGFYRAKAKNIEAVVFDRGGILYHGAIKALAESAREAGLKF